MDPRIDRARLEKQLEEELDREQAAHRVLAGAPLATALQIPTEELDRMRQNALELACQGHLERSRETIQTLVLLGDTSSATALVFAECLRREGRAEEAEDVLTMLKPGGEPCPR